MKKLLFLALAMALAGSVFAQGPTFVVRATLANAWDMDGEAADPDQIVVAVAMEDDKDDYTIAAQPDICRLVDTTIVDTNLTAGNLTITGVGCLGEAKVCSFAFTAGNDTGVQTLTCTDAEGAYYASVTTAETDTLTGESDETFALGYTSNSVNGWPMHGVRTIGPNAENGVNPFGAVTINRRITTSGVASTALAAVDTAENPFEQVSVGDIIIVTLSGVPYERRVTVVTDDDNITVNANINIPAAGVSYSFRKFWYSSNPDHRMFIPVHGNRAANFDWAIDANANTGGVDMLLECIGQQGPEFPVSHWVQVQTTNTASGGTQAATTESMNLEVLPYTACRIGFAFGTGDDVDAADEDISVTVSLMR